MFGSIKLPLEKGAQLRFEHFHGVWVLELLVVAGELGVSHDALHEIFNKHCHRFCSAKLIIECLFRSLFTHCLLVRVLKGSSSDSIWSFIHHLCLTDTARFHESHRERTPFHVRLLLLLMRVCAIWGILRWSSAVLTLVSFCNLVSLTRPIIGNGLEIPAARAMAGTFGVLLHHIYLVLLAT